MRISILVLPLVLLFVLFEVAAQKYPDGFIVKITGYGSGVQVGAGIIVGFNEVDQEALLVTALHVVEETDSLLVEFRQHSKGFPATILKVKPELDLAVLRVNIQGADIDFRNLVVAESSDFRLSLVKIIGNPQGSSWVTRLNKFLTLSDGSNFTVSNEMISGGFSGGGVFTKNNRIMGMMIENRSQDALVVDILAILALLNEWNVEANLLVRPKLKLETAAIMGAGTAGILVSLVHFEKKSKDQYTIYEENLFSNDQIYADLGMTRDEVFQDAESKRKTAIIVGVIGGTVLAAGTYMLIKKLNKRKKEKRHDGLVVVPHFELPDYVESSGRAVSFGVTIKF